MEELKVQIDSKPENYRIYTGYGVLGEIAEKIAGSGYGSKLAIIADSNTKSLFGISLQKELASREIDAALLDFPAGEKSKTRRTKEILEDKLIEKEFGRDSAIIALGGGVVGDIAGFVASTYMRGIPHVQVPTTTMAQADSSIGGKTAVNAGNAKNIIGSFWQPKDVFIDIKMLETLDRRNYNSGLVEAIKHGIIKDSDFFEFIEKNLDIAISRNSGAYAETMAELMRRNCMIKNGIVRQDERESDLRKILNYGHTIGHAVEALSDFSLLHGEAVAIGIAAEAFFSYELGYCGRGDYERQLRIIRKIGLPMEIPNNISVDDIIGRISLDKKARNNSPEFVMLERIGNAKTFNGKHAAKIDAGKIRTLLEEFSHAG